MNKIFDHNGFNPRSFWFRLAIVMITLMCLASQGGKPASAAPAITIHLSSTADNTTSDNDITLREAILLVNGGTGGDGARTGLGRALSTQESARITGGTIGGVGVAANIVFSDLPGLSTIHITSGTGSANESLPPVMTSGVVINGANSLGSPVTLDGSGAPSDSDVLWLGWHDPAATPTTIIPVANMTVQNIAITGAQRYGIHLDPARNSLISGCSVTGSTGVVPTYAAIYINGKFGLADHDTVENCTIGNNGALGVDINRPDANNAIIRNSKIGTNAAGTAAAPNAGAGIALFSGVHDVTITGNVISGNTLQGIYVEGAVPLAGPTTHITITNNKIGVGADGITPIPNVQGVVFAPSSSLNTVGGTAAGQRNIIAYNTQSGVVVVGNGSTGNHISGNAIFANGILGIDLLDDKTPTVGVSGGTTGPNDLALRPTLTKAKARSTVAQVSGTASPNSTIEIFVADASLPVYGSGRIYCASVTANGSGAFNFFGTVSCTPGAGKLTATSTLADGSTSEFGVDLAVTALPVTYIPLVTKAP